MMQRAASASLAPAGPTRTKSSKARGLFVDSSPLRSSPPNLASWPPRKPIASICSAAGPHDEAPPHPVSEDSRTSLGSSRQAGSTNDDTLNQAIGDLEAVLNEALSIAQGAVATEQSREHQPSPDKAPSEEAEHRTQMAQADAESATAIDAGHVKDERSIRGPSAGTARQHPPSGHNVPAPERKAPQAAPRMPQSMRLPSKEQHNRLERKQAAPKHPIKKKHAPSHEDDGPSIQPRTSSRLDGASQDHPDDHHPEHLWPRQGSEPPPIMQPPVQQRRAAQQKGHDLDPEEGGEESCIADFAGYDHYGLRNRANTREWPREAPRDQPGIGPGALPHEDTITSFRGPRSIDNGNPQAQAAQTAQQAGPTGNQYSLKGKRHVSLKGNMGFSLSRSHRRAPLARDWSNGKKRAVAFVTCVDTALLGLIIGIYAGEVPAIQYAIVDEGTHYATLGNVLFFIGMAVPTALFFPLPLLHGRKPYTLAALALLLPLQFPQALAVQQQRSPYLAEYRWALLLPRAVAGVAAGFVNMNLMSTLLDLFGSSLMSTNPHQEVVNENDVRRHGGGIGVWLGIWTWCSIGSIGVGFSVGAAIISGLNVAWGFWISIILTVAVLLLNVATPEVRRAAYRRSMAEVRTGSDISRRVAKGEIMMHLYSTGPRHFWEELVAGHVLCVRMLRQPGFLILALYQGWVYAQVVMVIILLGALTSRDYRYRPQYVGLCVLAIPLGALVAIPFQKASLFSRSRSRPPRTDSMTFEKRVAWTTHLVRRAVFMVALPFAALAYTLSSGGGARVSVALPVAFAAAIGFLSNLALSECSGIVMEAFDTSDLQPGMTGRPRKELSEETKRRRTNFSCFPRVTAAFAVAQTFAFLISAGATLCGGTVVRRLGAQAATGVAAAILLVLTLLLIAALTRYRTVQVVPGERYGTNVLSGPGDDWKPVILGHPSGTTRRMSLLELGALTRWTEIRRRNRLLADE